MGIQGSMRRVVSAALLGALFWPVMQVRVSVAASEDAPQRPLEKTRKRKTWPDAPLRGLQVYAFVPSQPPGFLGEEDFRKFDRWNVNVLRLWLDIDPDSPWAVKPGETPPPVPTDDPMAPYRKNLEGLRIALALAQKHHIYLVLVAGGVVGRGADALARETDAGGCYPSLAALWEHIARTFGGNPWLLAYDLMNEPNTRQEVDSWHARMLPQLVKRVRAIDANTYLVIETAPWALPDQAFPASLVPIEDPKAVYSFHFYYPHTYTHQGIGTYKGPEFEGKPYPGVLRLFPNSAPVFWDKAALEESMRGVIEFQKKHGVKVFVGEFSVIRRAPGAAQWLSDVLDLFEKYRFSWAYHCYGSWNGWNPTFAAEAPESSVADGGQETDRMKLLLKAWSRNERL